MFVFSIKTSEVSSPTNNLIWSGIIPIKVKNDIIIDPSSKKVTYGGIEIPKGFGSYTGKTEVEENTGSSKTLYIIVTLIILILLICIAIYFYRKRMNML